ncbi:hypothetical protein IKF84_02155 [Candidatus Saccharibacteria bacterium]|nr:hypothetical protein [Candidatus Saccharibacteria bacterium]
MNKDVVYIEPEEDITDIIGKIEGSKSKIVALVPPKKAGVFKSIVNIKLIMKTGVNAGKKIVLVTTDPAIIKLAAATKMPVTKDLKSAPEIPEMDEVDDSSEVVEVDDEAEEDDKDVKDDEGTKEDEGDAAGDEEEADDDSDDDEEDEDDGDKKAADKEEDEETDKNDGKEKKEKKTKDPEAKGKLANSNNPVLRWIGTHKKITAGICVGLVLMVIAGIWAFGIMPAVTITLKLETTTGNFSENISFTDKATDEKVSEGKFYIQEKKIESKAEVEFEATGKKNVGEKASGTLTVYYIFKTEGSISVNAGSSFAYSNLSYLANANTTIAWGGKDSECKNKDDDNIGTKGCYIYKEIAVTAAEAGANYNISATGTGWVTNSGVTVASGSAMSGGSDKTVTIVQQSDIDKALQSISTENETVNKEKLYETIEGEQFEIDSSFKQTVGDPVSTPAVGQEIEDGKKAKLSVTTTATVFTVDEDKLIEYITEKVKLEDKYKIYEMNDPFVENFTKIDSGYTGRLKTAYIAGPTISQNDVVEEVKGKGIGTAKRDLTDKFKGIKTITIDTSAPWVSSVPGNPEKITVNIDVEE